MQVTQPVKRLETQEDSQAVSRLNTYEYGVNKKTVYAGGDNSKKVIELTPLLIIFQQTYILDDNSAGSDKKVR